MRYEAIDKKLRTLFPKVFAYLDEEYPSADEQSHWVLAVKNGHSAISISDNAEPSGEVITDTRHPKGRKYGVQSVYFGEYSSCFACS